MFNARRWTGFLGLETRHGSGVNFATESIPPRAARIQAETGAGSHPRQNAIQRASSEVFRPAWVRKICEVKRVRLSTNSGSALPGGGNDQAARAIVRPGQRCALS
jgi:hypothetical protein